MEEAVSLVEGTSWIKEEIGAFKEQEKIDVAGIR